MEKIPLTQVVQEIADLMEKLRKEGKFIGRKDEYIVFDQKCRLISIVSQAGLTELLGAGLEIGGWQKIEIE